MRITEDGIIYLSQPVAGRDCLVGPATIGTTWLDYTVPDDPPASGASLAEPPGASLAGCRLLIPITNVIAVVIPGDGDE